MVDFAYKLVRSRRKTLQVIVRRGEIIVRAPLNLSGKCIENFVESKANWVKNVLERQKNYFDKIQIAAKETVLLFGREVKLPAGVAKNYPEIYLKYYALFIERLEERIIFLSEQNNLPFGKLRFSNARTLWGTCDADNNIRVNWRLVLLPSELIDYVIIHELSHTVHYNHSRYFWDFLAAMLPDYKLRKKKLKEFSWVLEAYR
jgi:hypothetical protein